MADSASDSFIQFDTFGLRKIGSSIFGIPGFLAGNGSKCSSDSDPVWSPTSPLDFRGFVNLSNPFSARSRKPSFQNCHPKKWNFNKVVGLGIVISLDEENKSTDDALDSLKRKNIVFGQQVKLSTLTSSGNYSTFKKSNSLPRNYIVPPTSPPKTPSLQLGSSNGHLEPELFKSSAPFFPGSTRPSSSLIGSSENQDLSLLPTPIGTGQGYVSSLSAREIELSEDYTCIISHGPNPRTTHIFGDCVLEGPVHDELANFDRQGVETPLVAEHPELLARYPSDDFLSFCYLCKKKLVMGADIYMYRGEKAFCSFECRDKEILAEEEEEEGENSSKSSPGSSVGENFFIMGLPTVA